MRAVSFRIKGISPYSQSKLIVSARNERELHKDHEERCWRERMHDKEGEVFIPPMAIKHCMYGYAKYSGIQIPGKGKSTYTKHFDSGILAPTEIMLGIKVADVEGEWLYVPSDGRRGGPKRVWKCFPKIEAGWEAEVNIFLLDDIITEDVFAHNLDRAGSFMGLGRFRPQNGGFYGRFKPSDLVFGEEQK